MEGLTKSKSKSLLISVIKQGPKRLQQPILLQHGMELNCIHLTPKKCFAKFNDPKHLLFKTLAFLHLMNLVELLLHHI